MKGGSMNGAMTGVRQIVVTVVMLVAAGLAIAMKPADRMAEQRPPIQLEQAIPRSFGEWRVDPRMAPVTVSPDVQAALDKIYSQTLGRTYINGRGEMIMLSVAYGGDQSRATQVHKPEVCYPMQGFRISSLVTGMLETLSGQIPIMRLVAEQGQRIEPITYWIAVGDTVVRGAFEQNMARLKYGLTGTVPEGILVRVSTISRDTEAAYVLEERFVSEMLKAMAPGDAARLLGRFGGISAPSSPEKS